jgi:branched-chain amino acid transport system substrate-binding protein
MRESISSLARALAAMLLLLAGLDTQAATIKIASQSPLSGSLSVFGVDIKNGAQLAVEQLSGPLTKMGFKVELAPYDDQANPDTGVANAKAIVSDPDVLAVVAHYNSGVFIPSSEEYHAANLAAVSPATTNPRVTDRGYPEVSRVVGRDDVQGAAAAQLAKDLGFKVVYVVHNKTAYGQGIAEFFKKDCEKNGIRVAGFTGTEEKANFDAILAPVLAAKPDCLYLGGDFDQAAVLFKQARQRGFKGVFMSDDSFDSPDASKIGGEALVQDGGTYYTTVSGPAASYPGAAAFVTAFKAKFGANPQPYAAQAYDSAAILLKAIENAAREAGGKVPAREDVAKAVRALKAFKGITATITFDHKGDPEVSRYFVVKVTAKDPSQWDGNKVLKTLDIKAP